MSIVVVEILIERVPPPGPERLKETSTTDA